MPLKGKPSCALFETCRIPLSNECMIVDYCGSDGCRYLRMLLLGGLEMWAGFRRQIPAFSEF